MRPIDNKTYRLMLAFIVVFGFAFSSCNKDEVTAIVPKTLEAYKADLSKLISSEKTVANDCIIGYGKGNAKVSATATFPAIKTTYLNALTAAEVVLNKPNVTITELVNADKSLSVPGKAFWAAVFTSDRQPLNLAIIEAETLNAATLTGTLAGQVAIADKTTFTTAITTAKATRDATVTIDRQVTDGLTKLAAAKLAFQNAIIK